MIARKKKQLALQPKLVGRVSLSFARDETVMTAMDPIGLEGMKSKYWAPGKA